MLTPIPCMLVLFVGHRRADCSPAALREPAESVIMELGIMLGIHLIKLIAEDPE